MSTTLPVASASRGTRSRAPKKDKGDYQIHELTIAIVREFVRDFGRFTPVQMYELLQEKGVIDSGIKKNLVSRKFTVLLEAGIIKRTGTSDTNANGNVQKYYILNRQRHQES